MKPTLRAALSCILPALLMACAAPEPPPPSATSADPSAAWATEGGDDSGGGGDAGSQDGGGDGGGGDGGSTDGGSTDGGGDSGLITDTGDVVDTGDGGDDTGDAAQPIVIYAVRHAEKDSDSSDPGLTEEGQARAEALVPIMQDVPLTAVYASTYRRTQETVAPTAADHELDVITDYDPEDELAEHILANHAEESVLHAGHSFTLRDFMEALGVEDPPSVSAYGDLWIITIEPDGDVTVVESHYGD